MRKIEKEREFKARQWLKDHVIIMKQENIDFFIRMYGSWAKDIREISIEEVIDRMPFAKLDWAMCQVESTIQKVIRDLKIEELPLIDSWTDADRLYFKIAHSGYNTKSI